MSIPEKPTYEALQRRISELEANQADLTKANLEMDQLFSMVPDMICIADLQTSRFLKVNPAFTQTLGYPAAELLEKPVFDFIHPGDIQTTRQVIEKKLRAGTQAINFENRYRCRDGSYRWLSWVSHPDMQKGIAYTVARDITRIKEAEKRLTDSEKRYKGLFNSTNDGICLHEIVYNGSKPVDYRILDINPKYEELTGIKGKDAIGALATDLYKTETAPYLEKYAEVARTGKPVTFETYFPPMEKSFLISVFSPEAHRFATVFQDITERKKIERALMESESRYRSLFHNYHSVMLLIDPESGAILDANPAAVSYYGWTYDEITRKNISDINTLTEAQVHEEMDHAEKELRNVFNFTHRLADGSVHNVEVFSGPIVIRDRKLLYSIIHDVTERIKAEEDRTRLIEELQTALKEIKTLRGILPICSSCKKIRDDQGYWNKLEAYLYEHSGAQFSHGFCPDCMKKLYPDYADDEDDKQAVSKEKQTQESQPKDPRS